MASLAAAAASGVPNNPQDHYSNNNTKDSDPSPSSPSNPCMRSMEEVWQEINLSSLLDHSRPGPGSAIAAAAAAAATSTFHSGRAAAAVSLEDFLALPFHKDSNNNKNPPPCHSSTGDGPVSAFPRPPPAPFLGLTSRSEFSNCVEGPVYDKFRADPPQVNPFLSKNGALPMPENGDGHSERRRKRLMKNRESAARSRARKQAYMSELENEVTHLQEENDRLRRQYHELRLACPAPFPKKLSLRRTLTAQF